MVGAGARGRTAEAVGQPTARDTDLDGLATCADRAGHERVAMRVRERLHVQLLERGDRDG
ncbi:hypothetical protein ASG23_15085 [Cellulomonas sp. Leaf395]|nr:hypothetical protein ASG23_15085 [Cellulomonas sp. Leaf395]